MSPGIWIAIAVGAAVLGLAAGFIGGVIHRRRIAEKTIGSAEAEAKKIMTDAANAAEQAKKDSIAEAKSEILALRTETDKELRDRRSEIQRSERRLSQREENLDKKTEAFERKETALADKLKAADEKLVDAGNYKRQQSELLERISGMSRDQAKVFLLQSMEEGLEHEKAVRIRNFQARFEDEKDELARELVTTAIQRCAADITGEVTVSVVQLPNDEMKGRIIGREGRNVHTIEQLTGVDLIIDDTPETIIISCYDQARREIARILLERLIADGRIHPARIEEVYKKARDEIMNKQKQAGEKAVIEAGVNGVSAEMRMILGALYYRTSYGQNVLRHSVEVSLLAGTLAAEIGADVKLAKRAGLLHDIGKTLSNRPEGGSHVDLGVDLARKNHESEAVIHAIAAHHGDIEAKSTVAVLVQAADAISAARPGARRENVENYIARLQNLEKITSEFDGVEKCYAIQAGREVRVIVKPDQIGDDAMPVLARKIADKIEQELDYPGMVKINLIRETRTFEYAK
ncbi:MAG: ribonuclease Y [Clostridiales bacterium]|nr:ribonuclease Y [Clostridiales bacterium]